MGDTMYETSSAASESRFAGQIGFAGVIALAVLLIVHPFGTTELYEDGFRFLDHVTWFWVTIHLLGALAFMTWLPAIGAWARGLEEYRARVVGRWAYSLAIGGFAVGTIHLAAMDTLTFWFFRDTYEAAGGSEAGEIAADLLLRLHGASLSAWITIFWFAVPLLGGIATLLDNRMPRWVGWVGVVGGGLQVPALALTLGERQWTTLSEQIVLRTGATLFLVWMLAITWSLRRGAPIGQPAPQEVVSSPAS